MLGMHFDFLFLAISVVVVDGANDFISFVTFRFSYVMFVHCACVA